MVAGDVVNTAARLQAAAPVERRPRRRGDLPRDRARDRVPRRSSRSRPRARPSRCRRGRRWRPARGSASTSERGPRRRSSDASTSSTLLPDALARARDERAPQLVTLVGVPGMGKSRLVCELLRRRRRGPGARSSWRQGRCLPYGEGVTFWALGEMVKAQAGILETDPADVAEAQARREAVARLLADATRGGLGRVGTCARSSASAASRAAGDRRGEAFAAWRRFFEALAERQPARARLRGPALGGRRPARLRRPPRRLGRRRPAARRRHSAAGAARRGGPAGAAARRTPSRMSLTPLSDEETAALVGTRSSSRPVLPARDVQRALLAQRRRQPALRRGVRPHAGRATVATRRRATCRCPSRCRASSRPASTRSRRRRSRSCRTPR